MLTNFLGFLVISFATNTFSVEGSSCVYEMTEIREIKTFRVIQEPWHDNVLNPEQFKAEKIISRTWKQKEKSLGYMTNWFNYTPYGTNITNYILEYKSSNVIIRENLGLKQ